tara:strand:+ start:389 stop:622 length:234 start_codon:yes stop_codon:yes gene_type:complete
MEEKLYQRYTNTLITSLESEQTPDRVAREDAGKDVLNAMREAGLSPSTARYILGKFRTRAMHEGFIKELPSGFKIIE